MSLLAEKGGEGGYTGNPNILFSEIGYKLKQMVHFYPKQKLAISSNPASCGFQGWQVSVCVKLTFHWQPVFDGADVLDKRRRSGVAVPPTGEFHEPAGADTPQLRRVRLH